MLYVTHILVLAIGFVIGVLFGRRNKKKVESAIAKVKEEYKERFE